MCAIDKYRCVFVGKYRCASIEKCRCVPVGNAGVFLLTSTCEDKVWCVSVDMKRYVPIDNEVFLETGTGVFP